MERAFIISEESSYFQQWQEYCKTADKQKEFINRFFKENEIEATTYMVSGTGLCGVPFNEDSKKDIWLYIDPTENDLLKFEKILTKPNSRHGLRAFKKTSKISKDFAQKCIDKQIVINLYEPRVSSYFKSLGYMGCGYTLLPYNGELYIKVDSNYLKTDDTPEGFKEIKLSEFYKIKEEFELLENNK